MAFINVEHLAIIAGIVAANELKKKFGASNLGQIQDYQKKELMGLAGNPFQITDSTFLPSRVIIRDGEEEYELDATESFSRDTSAKVTDNPISTGNSISDNYSVDNRTVSFSGIISNDKLLEYKEYDLIQDSGSALEIFFGGPRYYSVKSPKYSTTTTKTAKDFVKGLDKIFEERRIVTIEMPDGIEFKEAVITKLGVSRDKETSTGFKVSLTLQEIVRSQKGLINLKLSARPVPKSALANKLATSNSKAGSTGKQPVEEVILDKITDFAGDYNPFQSKMTVTVSPSP